MTTVTTKKNHDQDKVNEISEKLMENPELAKLIGQLSTSTGDASDLVKGLLQASITAGLQAEMDEHLGYAHSDHSAKAQLNTPGWRQSPQRVVHQNCAHRLRPGRDYGARRPGGGVLPGDGAEKCTPADTAR